MPGLQTDVSVSTNNMLAREYNRISKYKDLVIEIERNIAP